MRQTRLFNNRVLGYRIIVLAVFCALTAAMFIFTGASTTAGTSGIEPQQRARSGRRTGRRSLARSARPLPRFSHATKGHYENCYSCHKIEAFEDPQIKDYLRNSDITDYPDHDACLSCHRQRYQPLFFKGARPSICTICHTVVSPRSDARFDFPKPNVDSQFADIFPHSKHFKSTSLPMFRRIIEAKREASGAKGTSAKFNAQDSCAHCHQPDKTEFKLPAGSPEGAFVPRPGTFMATPTSHASCFDCHWKEGVEGKDVKPWANQCNECHQNIALPMGGKAITATPPSSEMKIIPAVATSHAAPVAADTRWPHRISPKFIHEIDAHKKKSDASGKEVPITCIQCHTTIRKVEKLEDFNQKQHQVQIPTCGTSACHSAISGSAALKLSVVRELRAKAKDPKFDCAFCHLPNISTSPDVPCSHYMVAYKTAVDEKKDPKPIETLIPPRCKDEVKSSK